MTTKHAFNRRLVVIERGPKGFGFTVRRPQQPSSEGSSGQVEPVYTLGAQVRSVEDQGPAQRGGLEKDEFVTTINKEFVRGKTYLQVMTMIQGTNRLLSLEVASPVLSEAGEGDEQAVEECVAEKENQVQFGLHHESVLANISSPASSWRPSVSSVAKELDRSASASASETSTTVVLPARTAAIYTDEQRFRIIREFEQCARDHSGDEEEEDDPSSFRRLSRLHSQAQAQARQQTNKSPVFGSAMPKSSIASGSLTASPGLYSTKAFGLTRSTGHLCDSVDEPGEGRPMVTFKKAYASPVAGAGGDVPSGPQQQTSVTSSVSSAGTVVSAGGSGSVGTPRRTSLGVSGTREEVGRQPSNVGRYLHHQTTTEPRINFKKRKSGNNNTGIGSNYASTPSVNTMSNVNFRAHSVTNLPGGTEAGHRTGATISVLSNMPSASRHQRVGSPPTSILTSTALMHSPLRRGSSPARSTPLAATPSGAPAAPLSGVEEFDNSIPTSPTVSPSSGFHETRFSMVPDKVVTTCRGQPNAGRQRGPLGIGAMDEVEGGGLATTMTATASFTPASNRLWTVANTSSPHNSAIVSPQQQQVMEASASGSSSSSTSSTTTTTTINIRSGYRTSSQTARYQFMMSQPTPAPPLPLPFSSSPASGTTSVVTTTPRGAASGTDSPGDSSVLRRESYINAVKTTRTTTLVSPDAIVEGDELDDDADSAIEDSVGDNQDGQNSNLSKAKRFFGESWTRKSGRNKTPKVRDALAATASNASSHGPSSEKKFYLSVKVVREDGKEARSKSWKSFSLTIENDVLYLIRERKESSASSSSSAEDMSPIPLRYCHFEWTSPDLSRKKYLVCRMYVNPPSMPTDSSSSTNLATSSLLSTTPTAPSATSLQPTTSSASLHGSSPPNPDLTSVMTSSGSGFGVSEYKLQFSNPDEMQAFYHCLPDSSATVSMIGGLPDYTATYPPPSKVGKKLTKHVVGPPPTKAKKDPFELEMSTTSVPFPTFPDAEFPLGGAHQQPSSSKRLFAFVRNIRWKSSSTESSTTTSSYTTKLVRTDDYTARMKSTSPDDIGRPLPGMTFGVPLMQVPRSSISPYVPLVVELCTRIVESCGLHCVGVYRVSPKKAVIDALEAELNECGSRLDLIDRHNEKWNDVHAVSGLLKCFLRKMPDPVFPFGLYSQFLEASDRRLPHERKMLLLQRLLTLMDGESPDHPEYKHHRETLKYLSQHLSHVAQHSHINKMTTKNLVSMIAPNVFRPPGDSNVTLLMQATAQGATILELIVHYHEWFFSTDMEAACDVPAPLPTETGPSIADHSSCDNDGESTVSCGPSTEEALGGAEDRGPQSQKPGEKATDILAAVLDAAIACQEEVSPELAGSLDEGGFDEVDIDAAVRRRQQQDEAAAAAAASVASLSATASTVTSNTSLINSSFSTVSTCTLLTDGAPSVTATPATPIVSSSSNDS